MYIYIYIYQGRLKGSKAEHNTIMECDQIRFIFQHSALFGSHISSIGIAVLGSHW